jgi:hypothetical protein
MPPSFEDCVSLVEKLLQLREEEVAWDHLGDGLDALEQVDRYRQWHLLACTDVVDAARHQPLLASCLGDEEWRQLRQVKKPKHNIKLRDKYWSASRSLSSGRVRRIEPDTALGWRRLHISNALLAEDVTLARDLERRYLTNSSLLDDISEQEQKDAQEWRDSFNKDIEALQSLPDPATRTTKMLFQIGRVNSRLHAWKKDNQSERLYRIGRQYLLDVKADRQTLLRAHRALAQHHESNVPLASEAVKEPAPAPPAPSTAAPASSRQPLSPIQNSPPSVPPTANEEQSQPMPILIDNSATQESTLEYVNDPPQMAATQQEEDELMEEDQMMDDGGAFAADALAAEAEADPPDVDMDEPSQPTSPKPETDQSRIPPQTSPKRTTHHAERSSPAPKSLAKQPSFHFLPLPPFPSPISGRTILVPNSQSDETQNTISFHDRSDGPPSSSAPDRSSGQQNTSNESSVPENQLGLLQKQPSTVQVPIEEDSFDAAECLADLKEASLPLTKELLLFAQAKGFLVTEFMLARFLPQGAC